MRMNARLRQVATEELLALLADNPQGLPTRELVCTRSFNGPGALSMGQVRSLLRSTTNVSQSYEQNGRWTCAWWRIKGTGPDGARDRAGE
jgi:hypothetical protein